MPQAAEPSPPASAPRGRRAMLASRVARGSWGALRGAAWAPGARPGKGRVLRALLPPAPICLGCLAGRWWLRPAALGLWRPGAVPRGHCSGAGKAAPGPAAGDGAAAEPRGGRWGPAGAASLVRTGGRGSPGRGGWPCGGSVLDARNARRRAVGAPVAELRNRFPREGGQGVRGGWRGAAASSASPAALCAPRPRPRGAGRPRRRCGKQPRLSCKSLFLI